MTSYIGQPGALVPLLAPASEVMTPEREFSTLIPFEGGRVVQLGPRTMRAWAVTWDARHPSDYAVLDTFATWETPLVWVGALAQATNLLTPDESTFGDAGFSGGAGLRSGALLTGDMPVVRWAGGPVGSVVRVTSGVPVRPGVPVTVSAWTQRAATGNSTRLTYAFLDSAGNDLVALSVSGPAGDQLQRVSWTLTPPVGAAAMRILIRDAATVALPQVTWSSGAVGYAPGRGARGVMVVPGAESVVVAHSRQALADVAYTILEVG